MWEQQWEADENQQGSKNEGIEVYMNILLIIYIRYVIENLSSAR